MAFGSINGREINWFPINGGVNIKDLEAVMMAVQFSQMVELVRVRVLAPYGITTINSVLEQVIRTKALEPFGIFTLDSALEVLTRVREFETSGDIEFAQVVQVDLFPAMNAHHVIEFVFECEIENAFFGHWFDGLRMSVPFEDRTVAVPRDNRRIIVDPDPDELVEQKAREFDA